MGKLLGAHDSDELDRPDLNKCPDCLCFFAGDNCPLCGKECPEEMRAGNRAKVKPRKRRNPNAGRVTFIPWYHSWFFIILMMFVMPIVGMILLFTSPYRTKLKVIVAASLLAAYILFLFVISPFISIARIYITDLILTNMVGDNGDAVNSSISKAEYIDLCKEVDADDFYRSPGKYNGEYVKLSCTVVSRYIDSLSKDGNDIYYVCKTEGGLDILVRDCLLDEDKNFAEGDKITVYGEGRGNVDIFVGNEKYFNLPCVFCAYVLLNK